MSDVKAYPAEGLWVVRADGAVIAESRAAQELLEPGRAPVIYFPRRDVAMAFLEPSETQTTCPHKGAASHFHITSPGSQANDAAWSYETPVTGLEAIAGHVAFDAARVTVERL